MDSFYWVPKPEVEARLRVIGWDKNWLLGWRDVTDARASERTVVVSVIPKGGVGHSAPLILPTTATAEAAALLLANLSSLVLDYIARQKVGGLHLTIFVLNQLPVLPPSAYSLSDREYITSRIVELVYTARDLKPFGEALGSERPFCWDRERREQLTAEIDAYYAHLYGLCRDELLYILDPEELFGSECLSETFTVLKRREFRELGEYRTRRLVLAAYDELGKTDRFAGEKRESTIELPKGRSMVSLS